MSDLWFHDGSGSGWPAIETSRTETPEYDASGEVRHTLIRRTLIVFCGGEPNKAGLAEGVNIRKDVPEGLPTEGHTCSHHAHSPGSPARVAMLLHHVGVPDAEDDESANAAKLAERQAVAELHGVTVP